MEVTLIKSLHEDKHGYSSTDPELERVIESDFPPAAGQLYYDGDFEETVETAAYDIADKSWEAFMGHEHYDDLDLAVQEHIAKGWKLSRWVRRQPDGSLKDTV